MGNRSPEEIEALVVRALTGWGVKQRDVGAELGVSGASISHIRRGERHAEVRPDLSRWRSCEACQFWLPGCGMGFPDPIELRDLWQAATECSTFVKR